MALLHLFCLMRRLLFLLMPILLILLISFLFYNSYHRKHFLLLRSQPLPPLLLSPLFLLLNQNPPRINRKKCPSPLFQLTRLLFLRPFLSKPTPSSLLLHYTTLSTLQTSLLTLLM